MIFTAEPEFFLSDGRKNQASDVKELTDSTRIKAKLLASLKQRTSSEIVRIELEIENYKAILNDPKKEAVHERVRRQVNLRSERLFDLQSKIAESELNFKTGKDALIKTLEANESAVPEQRDEKINAEARKFLEDLDKPNEIIMPIKQLTHEEAHQIMITEGIFKEGNGWHEAIDDLLKEYDLNCGEGINYNLDLLLAMGISHYAEAPFALIGSKEDLKGIWLVFFRKCAREQRWSKAVKPKENNVAPISAFKKGVNKIGKIGAFAGLMATAFISQGHKVDLHNNKPVMVEMDSKPDDKAQVKSAIVSENKNEKIIPVYEDMPVWDYVKKLNSSVTMVEVLSDSRVSEYLDKNSSVKFDSKIAFASIKSELLEEGGFKGAFEMAPDATTINEYLSAIKDPNLAARMKAEFQMFGLKNPAELNSIVKGVVAGE